MYKIYNKQSNLPWQADNSNVGTVIRQRNESSHEGQLWRVVSADSQGYYKFESLNGGLAMDMDVTIPYQYLNNLQIFTPKEHDAQVFSLVKREESNGKVYYSMHNKRSGRALDVHNGSLSDGADIIQWDSHRDDSQLFYFVEQEARTVSFYDNWNNNYLPSPREVYNQTGNVIPDGCYRSRNTDGITVTIDPDNDALKINQKIPNDTAEMTWFTTLNDTSVYGINRPDENTSLQIKFQAKASVSGAKIYFRWGYDTDTYPVTLSTSWQDYTITVPRTNRSNNCLHPYIDKVCTAELRGIAAYIPGSDWYSGDTDAYTYQVVNANVNNAYSCKTPMPKRSRPGYEFIGWYTNRVGGTKVASGNDYYNVTNLTGNTNLYAHWKKAEVTLQSISIKTNPSKMTYTVGETLNTSGLVLTAKYSDGSTKDVTSGFTCSPTKLSTAGRQTITVTYSGKTTTFTVTVNNTTPTQGKVKSVEISDISLNYKSSTVLKPQITADSGVTYTVKYESSNPKVATVDQNGKVTATKRGSGSATITCTVTDQYGNVVKDTCTVNVSLSFGQKIIIYLLFGWIWY